jgi:signal transduction histidine kinase
MNFLLLAGMILREAYLDPEIIFEPHFTTKKDVHTGENIGTGLGMWIVKAFVLENNGIIDILPNRKGFGVFIKFSDATKK